MTTPISVCIVAGSTKPNDALPTAVAALQAAGAEVRAIAASLDATGLGLPPERIVDLGLTSPLPLPTRLLRRVTLAGSPAARRAWKAIRHDPRASALLNSAEVIVALDSAAIRAVWCTGNGDAVHGQRALVLGVPAAVEVVRARAQDVSPATP